MSKYDPLWEYIKNNAPSELRFEDVRQICGFPLDHSFLTCKKELEKYGYQVGKISMKAQTVKILPREQDCLTACGKTYRILKLLGHGKGGYSYLAECGGNCVVLKQIHHEPCDYYTFGDKIEAECRDYQCLKDACIRIPGMLAADTETERIVKEYIEGDTVFDYVRRGISTEPFLPQVREMAAKARARGLNIDYFPTNFVARDGLLWYIDYECNNYSDEWSFENWGIKYWSRTPELEEYLKRDGGR